MENYLTEFELNDAKFIMGEGCLCFQPVIETFKTAKFINILTYNISSSSNELLNALKQAGQNNIPIRIITNIPSRWPQYWGESFRTAARKNIGIYQRRLDPEKIGPFANIFFKFNNHGKIIMTDQVIYVGSANFSDESKHNFECGIISRDANFIQYADNHVFKHLITNATNYYAAEYNDCLMALYSAMALIHSIQQEIEESSFAAYEDYDTNFELVKYFNPYDNSLSLHMLEEYKELMQDIEPLLQDLQNNLYGNGKDAEGEELDELVEEYTSMVQDTIYQIEAFFEDIQPLAAFDEQSYANDLLTDKFAHEAYDENLDYYAQKAFEMGRDKKEELISNAKDSILSVMEALNKFEDNLRTFVTKVMHIAKCNEIVDNT